MLPWGCWVIVFGTVFQLSDWDLFEEFACLDVV
jgi:hypothetical protein